MIIIGDVHGCYDTLMALVAKLPKDDICLVGDLVDRGPKSRQVVQWAIDNKIPCVKGNHEDMMVAAVKNNDPESNEVWMMNGGMQTMDSYIGFEDDLEKHADWMDFLPLSWHFSHIKNDDGRELVVSHSNIGTVWGKSDEWKKNNRHTMRDIIMWGRNSFQDCPDIYNVVGHTPQEFKPRVKSFYANVDTGACFKRFNYGYLSALQYPSMQIFQQENIDE